LRAAWALSDPAIPAEFTGGSAALPEKT